MIGHDRPRALLLSLSDGSRVSFETKHRKHREIDLTGAEEELTERYGASGIDAFRNAFSMDSPQAVPLAGVNIRPGRG